MGVEFRVLRPITFSVWFVTFVACKTQTVVSNQSAFSVFAVEVFYDLHPMTPDL